MFRFRLRGLLCHKPIPPFPHSSSSSTSFSTLSAVTAAVPTPAVPSGVNTTAPPAANSSFFVPSSESVAYMNLTPLQTTPAQLVPPFSAPVHAAAATASPSASRRGSRSKPHDHRSSSASKRKVVLQMRFDGLDHSQPQVQPFHSTEQSHVAQTSTTSTGATMASKEQLSHSVWGQALALSQSQQPLPSAEEEVTAEERHSRHHHHHHHHSSRRRHHERSGQSTYETHEEVLRSRRSHQEERLPAFVAASSPSLSHSVADRSTALSVNRTAAISDFDRTHLLSPIAPPKSLTEPAPLPARSLRSPSHHEDVLPQQSLSHPASPRQLPAIVDPYISPLTHLLRKQIAAESELEVVATTVGAPCLIQLDRRL